MKYRKDDLAGIRKARFASFVLLLICFAAMFVLLALVPGTAAVHVLVAFAVIVCLALFWWFVYRRILLDEDAFFAALATGMRTVHQRLRMFESTVRQISDGVVIVSDDREFVFVNEKAKSLLAAFDDDLGGSRYDEYAAGFSEKLERAAILASARENRTPEIIDVEGQYYKIGYVALVPEEGRGQTAVAVISDVTENTKAEHMQIDFVANVSHELKTPLASVKGYAETLMAGAAEDEETMRDFLGIIVSEADRMDRLVRDLMYLARLDYADAGRRKPDEETDLPSLVRLSMKKLDMTASKKELSVNRMFSDELRLGVRADRDRIEQVVLNILGNAIKYTEEKGRVDVDIISGQNCVQIVISDNGVGIPEKDLPRVFERFFRVDKARSGKIAGTGLGLAISKQIVDAHGGAIGIESKYGRGTTVTITLPAGKTRGAQGIL